MLNKLYDKSKSFIKEYYKLIIGIIILIFLYTYKLDYQIYTYGTPINLNKRIEVENAKETKENFYITYVEARDGIIPFVLLSYIIPSWDLTKLSNSQIENETLEEINIRGKIDLETVNDYAIKAAFDLSNTPYKVEENKMIVYHVFENADTNLEVGDTILMCDGIKFDDSDELTSYLSSIPNDKEISFIVKNINGKEVIRRGKTTNYEGRNIIGIYLTNAIKINPSVDVKFNYSSSESGPSGGLMSSLEIYNKLTDYDITKGRKIAGTGTINYDGSVGSIGGVKYKLIGAVKNNSDIFIVPKGENYEEAKKLVEENNYDIKLIEASSLEEVVNELMEES